MVLHYNYYNNYLNRTLLCVVLFDFHNRHCGTLHTLPDIMKAFTVLSNTLQAHCHIDSVLYWPGRNLNITTLFSCRLCIILYTLLILNLFFQLKINIVKCLTDSLYWTLYFSCSVRKMIFDCTWLSPYSVCVCVCVWRCFLKQKMIPLLDSFML